MSRMIFVDDEAHLLAGLRRMLRVQRERWKMSFVESAERVLEQIGSDGADIVVADMRMPGMDGAELLNRIQRLFPETVRLGLSGYSDQAMVFRGLTSIHQFLSKPCESARFVAILQAILEARADLPGDLARQLTSLEGLTCRLEARRELDLELNGACASVDRVAEIVSGDLGMSARLLHLLHSSFFGMPRHLTGVREACELLGLARLRSLLTDCDNCFPVSDRVDPLWLDGLARHGSDVGRLAGELARAAGQPSKACDYACWGGVLHDLGGLALLNGHSEHQPAAGAYLLTLWGLPAPLVQAVAHHRHPRKAQERRISPLTFVHVADCWLHGTMGRLCLEYLADLEGGDHLMAQLTRRLEGSVACPPPTEFS